MTSLIEKGLEYYYESERSADPRVRQWFLMQSPVLPFLILIFYLYFVQRLGPRLMKNRPPFKIDKIVILYNAIQVIMSAYLVKEACRLVWFKGDYNFHCIQIDYTDTEEGRQKARTVWLYFMMKLLDLLDTVFFVLRKKQSQVTFLHVYHHSLVFSFGWFITRYYPGGHIAFFGTVNSFVHMIMYSYYLVTALHIVKNKSLWWKKYITQLQLVQFVVTGVHATLGLVDGNCNFPRYLIALGIPQDIFMFVLFWNFYRKTYMKKSKTIASKIPSATTNGSAREMKKEN